MARRKYTHQDYDKVNKVKGVEDLFFVLFSIIGIDEGCI